MAQKTFNHRKMSSDEEAPTPFTQPYAPPDTYCAPTNLGEDDGITSISSLTSTNDVINISLTSPVKHKCYDVLTGGRRPQLQTMPYRKELIERLHIIKKESFIPTHMMMSPSVVNWYSTVTAYVKHPRKWDRFIMAKAICDFDNLLTEASKQNANKACEVIAEFQTYMDDVREAASIKQNEPTVNRKGRIGSQKATIGSKTPLRLLI